MNIVSFFSGAGGLDLGFCLAGHRIIWANDFDKDAVDTYNNNIGVYQNHKALCCDIVQLLDCEAEEIDSIIPNCDVIIGGFPCQGFTIANLARSMADEKNYLYLQLLKAISVKNPKYFMLENVKGLENIDSGQVLPMILNDLERCGTSESKFFMNNYPGYTVVYNIFNAYFFGVPQNRERVIILGIRNDILDKSPLKRNILSEAIDKKYDDRKRLYIPYTYSSQSDIINPEMPKDLINRLYEDFIHNHVNKEKSNESEVLYRTTTLGDAIGDLPIEYGQGIPNHTGSKCKVTIKNRMGNRATSFDKRAPTIMGRGSGTGGPLIPPHPSQTRRLTVRETARIQTFPDKFVFTGANSSGYRQIGNAVPVLMAYNLAKVFNNCE